MRSSKFILHYMWCSCCRFEYQCDSLRNLAHWFKLHDDVIKWEHFPRNWPFVRESHRSPVNSPHKGQWRGALMFSLISIWINGWVKNREAGDLRRNRAHCDVIVNSPEQTGRNFANDIFICIFLNENRLIFIKIAPTEVCSLGSH